MKMFIECAMKNYRRNLTWFDYFRILLSLFRNLEEYTIDEAAQQEHLRNLEEIENQLDSEFGTFRLGGRNEDNNDAEATENSDVDDDDDKYCVVCEKAFKTQSVFVLYYLCIFTRL